MRRWVKEKTITVHDETRSPIQIKQYQFEFAELAVKRKDK